MNIAAKRLQSQRIAGPKFDTPEEVVCWMGAVQAQDYGQAVWAIASRTKQPSLAAVEQAIAERKILATWPMRGTIHFVPARDAKWMVRTLSYNKAIKPSWHQKLLEIDTPMLEKSRQVVTAALRGSKTCTRAHILELLESNGLPTHSQRGYLYISHLAEIGVICLAVLEGKQQTFALLDEWMPEAVELERLPAIAELARRYFRSHGPATIHDFANWTGLGLTEARQGLEVVKSSLHVEQYDEKDYWLSKETASHQQAPQGLHLLAGYDEFLLGYKDRSAVLHADHVKYIVPGNNGVFKPVIVVDGQIVGIWKRMIKKTRVDVSFTLFPERHASEQALQEAAEVYAQFLNLPLSVAHDLPLASA